MKSLDFMIIGAQKSGTTALSHFLSQHPDIVMAPGKEVHLFDAQEFAAHWTTEEVDRLYSVLFEGANRAALWGEATPIYLYRQDIISALQRYNPALKLIIILRDPVERAISHYEMERARKNEALPLWRALWRERERLAQEQGHLGYAHRFQSYTDRGLYAEQIACVRHHFSDEQVLILETDDLKHRHTETLRKVFEFLTIDATQHIPPERVFAGDYGNRKSSLHYSIIKVILRWRFRSANSKLTLLLRDMGMSPAWRWLK